MTSLVEADLKDFWDDSDYFTSAEPVAPALIQSAEAALGYRLPESYIRLLQTRNGGTPKRTCFPTTHPTSWAENHVAISGICGLGGRWGIDSARLGSRHMVQNWGYPAVGIVFGQCPSAGHDAIMLDYSNCGPIGEPRITHVNVHGRDEPDVTILAADFATFIRGLVHEAQFDTSTEDLKRDLVRVRTGTFSSQLRRIITAPTVPRHAENALRALCAALTESKGHFSLHADDRSLLVYDALFLFYTREHGPAPRDAYLAAYPKLIVFCDDEFRTGGYAPGFVEDWFDSRVNATHMRPLDGGYIFSPKFATEVQSALLEYG